MMPRGIADQRVYTYTPARRGYRQPGRIYEACRRGMMPRGIADQRVYMRASMARGIADQRVYTPASMARLPAAWQNLRGM